MSSRMMPAALALLLAVGPIHAQSLPPTPAKPSSDGVAPLSADAVKRIDFALTQAEVIVKSVEAVAKGGAEGACPANVTVRKITADIKNKSLTKETGDDLPDATETHGDVSAKVEWQLYNLCQALAARNVAPCADSAAITPKTSDNKGGRGGYEDTCARNYHKDRVRAAYVSRAPNFLDVCREELPQVAPFRDAAITEAACRSWLSGGSDALAQAISTGMKRPLSREEASQAALEMSASPAVCAKLPTDLVRRTCREQDSYRKAFAAKNPESCEGGICRVLMGAGAAACETYARSIKSTVCNSHYGPEFLAQNERDFKAAVDPAAAYINGVSPETGDAKAMRDLDSRVDRLFALRERFAKASDLIVPKKINPRPAAAKKAQ